MLVTVQMASTRVKIGHIQNNAFDSVEYCASPASDLNVLYCYFARNAVISDTDSARVFQCLCTKKTENNDNNSWYKF